MQTHEIACVREALTVPASVSLNRSLLYVGQALGSLCRERVHHVGAIDPDQARQVIASELVHRIFSCQTAPTELGKRARAA